MIWHVFDRIISYAYTAVPYVGMHTDSSVCAVDESVEEIKNTLEQINMKKNKV